MRVTFLQKTNSLWMEKLEPVRAEFPDVEIITDREEALEGIPETDVIIGGRIDREIFEGARNLKLVVVPFTGVNHLPFDLLEERRVQVANSHGNAWYVAERTVGMVLAYYGKIIEYHNDLREGRWHGFWVGQGLDDTWDTLDGKTAAILGTGEIGKNIAHMLKTFRVRTLGFKRRRVEELPGDFDEVLYDLKDAVDRSDVVIIALPSTSDTRGLFDESLLSGMAEKLLVNIGRGDIVDEKALYDALKEGTLGGAAVDCWYSYPKTGTEGFPSRFPVHELGNIVLSPHTAGYTRKSAEKSIEQACGNLAAFLRTGKPLFPVDLRAGY